MTRSFLLVVFYAFAGTLIAMVGYRILLQGPLAAPAQERSLDGLIIFLSILLNTALVLAAAGLTAAMIYPLQRSFVVAALASAVLAAVVGYLMMLWFSGLSLAFPVTLALSALVCAGLGRTLGLFRMPEMRE